MKLLNVILFSALTLVMVSCGGNSPKEMIIGQWQVSDVDMSAMMSTVPEERKAFVESMLPKMEESMKTTVMNFTKDGKVSIKANMMGQASDESGTYAISEDGKNLNMKTSGQPTDMEIESMTATELHVKQTVEGSFIKMVMKKK